ncbi:hypothetical protein G7Y89_g8716 [Cudoniella acicularis]|uniref:Ribosomal RNA-processing protein 40 n=1 Tax=Cudoniella acicularis TaxID=354080 RepID=A0A8H4RIV6_9HELO|nr:hypothetical protein G7Y89_g8716 [Cudoniella acicularis]
MATTTFVLPGQLLDPESLPSHPTLPLKLGPGLRHIPPNTITPTVAGQLCTDKRKNAVWVEFNGGRYVPTVGDLVIATIQKSSVDVYYASVSDYTSNATLPQLSFEARPRRRDRNSPLGHWSMARRLMLPKPAEQGGLVILEELGGQGVAFEIAVGRNGKVWVDSKSLKVGKSGRQYSIQKHLQEKSRHEYKAALKELKQTKEHEKKCIANMLKAEEDARANAVKAESQLRMQLMREEMRLKMELMREESEVRREAKRDDAVATGASPGASREPSRVAKRKRDYRIFRNNEVTLT